MPLGLPAKVAVGKALRNEEYIAGMLFGLPSTKLL